MANWAYGKVEIIGKFNSIRKFFEEELYHPDMKTEEWVKISDDKIEVVLDYQDIVYVWFKHLKRSHVSNCDMYVNDIHSQVIERSDNDDPISVHFTWAEAAWSWDDIKLAKISGMYNLEIFVHAEEPNMAFRQFIHVKDGRVMEFSEEDISEDDESEEIYDD
ncbi:MAG: hypothetical protein J6Y02_04485 [Pseudobutyrivibrio sp.]|nr:hypothetical protein [Pseudobutyrivibrio sp.]